MLKVELRVIPDGAEIVHGFGVVMEVDKADMLAMLDEDGRRKVIDNYARPAWLALALETVKRLKLQDTDANS